MAQDTFQLARERYTEAVEAFSEQRKRMIEDLKFSNPADPQQWDQRTRQVRENGPDGARPCLTLDRTNQYINQVVNEARKNKPGPVFMPVSSGARQEVAKALEGLARNIEYQSRAQIAYDTAIDSAARCGIGWMRITPVMVNAALNHQEIRIQRIFNPLSVVCDPDWAEPDGSDIQYGFLESLITESAFKKRWPKAKTAEFETSQGQNGWVQENKKLRICEYFELVTSKVNKIIIELPDGTKQTIGEDDYWKKAQQLGFKPMVAGQYIDDEKAVKWRTMNGVDFMEETDFPSCYIPLIPIIGNELYIEEKRYLCGMTRRMMEAQRAYNYERSAWVEAVALQPKAPIMAASEAVEGHESEWARMNRTNLAYLPFNAYDENGNALPMPQRTQPPQLPTAFAQGAQFANDDLQSSVGIYNSSLGQRSNEHSGVAIRARQSEGDNATYQYGDNQSRSIEQLWRVVLDMIPRVYDTAREVRILGTDGTAKAIVIDPEGAAYEEREDGSSTINMGTGIYDVRIKTGPAYTTLREEASEQLGQMMQNPALAAVVGPIWARMQDWPEADKLSKALLAMAPPQVQQAMDDGQKGENVDDLKKQLQQQEQQLNQMHQMMDLAGQKLQEMQKADKETTLKYLAEAAKIENDEFKAHTDRIKVVGAGMTPEQVQALVMQTVAQAMQQEPLDGGEELERQLGTEQQEAPEGRMQHAPGMVEQAEPNEPQEIPGQSEPQEPAAQLGTQQEQPEPPEIPASEMSDEQLLAGLK